VECKQIDQDGREQDMPLREEGDYHGAQKIIDQAIIPMRNIF
jgi:hypothetical protein